MHLTVVFYYRFIKTSPYMKELSTCIVSIRTKITAMRFTLGKATQNTNEVMNYWLVLRITGARIYIQMVHLWRWIFIPEHGRARKTTISERKAESTLSFLMLIMLVI